MNERIREIAEQAVKDVDVVHEDNPFNEELAKMYIPNVFIERFAELIVKECIECVDGYTKPRTGNTEYDAVEQIKQHFGVEL